MTSVAGVEPAEAAKVEKPRIRRVGRIVGMAVVLLLVAGAAAWQVAARTAQVELGSASNSGAGATLPDCVPSDGLWAMFGTDEDVVLVQTVRNPSRWPITVISRESEVYRFEPMADDFRDDYLYVKDPVDGAPDPAQTSDRVVIPPDREATMWIVNPQGDVPTADGWSTFGGAHVTLRSLGVEREFYLPLRGTVAVGGADPTAGRLDRALQEACA
ncbi:hypothetical protein C8K30_104381 [Promicromonospora sp. AC04]|uniref:hypothetical protein n=1 Tax=Promicromonospora sp. AC04 TaxID=2135723 RepID=UPI000D3C14BE|nr:hypothetical protein [Promicromonospora sp. AC04]PUB27928.1 hypothetical protein C8K30_104381 [Promicromonospora sp. AC04]